MKEKNKQNALKDNHRMQAATKKSKFTVLIVVIALILTLGIGHILMEKSKTATFGTYDGEAIEWLVLDEDDEGAKLLVSKNVLFIKAFNSEWDSVTWKDCSLREYLNTKFYTNTFTEEEQSKIKKVEFIYGSKDKVSLLSEDEINTYFHSDHERIAYLRGEEQSYWLCTSGDGDDFVVYVSDTGSVDEIGQLESYKSGVRPAIWVYL